ncbi:MAG TPA: hypothetical protein VNF47_17190 [Streptosporangiaceae bacterium]|nr:hypothetical protein [Streptosporangiaceae bacterium]
MSQMITIAILVATFLTGGIAGAIVLICACIGREESRHSLMRKPAGRACAATRRIVGFTTDVPQR